MAIALEPLPHPIDTTLDEIERALSAGFWYLAIGATLTLPDICAALASANGQSSGQKYCAWYEANIAAQYPWLTAEDCYCLRCGVSHQGRLGHPNMQYARVLFTVPNAQRNFFHNNIMNDALNLDAQTFCRDFIVSVRAWLAANAGDPNVQANLPHLLQYRPQGLAPYMVGMPLIS